MSGCEQKSHPNSMGLGPLVEPVLKWAGGKRWLVSSGGLPEPRTFERYVEPFVGSGAVYFHLQPRRATLSDLNAELILLYQTIRDRPAELWQLMLRHQEHHTSEYYYKMRAATSSSDLELAARFLYLNRTCWNGLYRVNLKGKFNVPKGTKNTVVFNTDDFEEVARALGSAEILCADFEEVLAMCGEGDFVFVDPPYTVKHNANNFLKYNEKIFSWNDQQRLREAILDAGDRGATIALTNADHDSIHRLYKGRAEYRQLTRQSVLGCGDILGIPFLSLV